MSTLERRDSPVFRQVEAYEEAWKKDHDAAQARSAWEDILAVGISTGLLLERVDRAWRERVFRGTQDYADEANETHRALFSTWLVVTDAVLAGVAQLQTSFAAVEGAPELRQLVERVRDHLAHWEAPRLSLAVGLRELTLTPAAATEVVRILHDEPAPPMPLAPQLQAITPEEFLRRFPKRGQ